MLYNTFIVNEITCSKEVSLDMETDYKWYVWKEYSDMNLLFISKCLHSCSLNQLQRLIISRG
jgi:hypothetical protein